VGVLYCGVLWYVMPSMFLAGCRRPVQKEQFENIHQDWWALPPPPMLMFWNLSNDPLI
jgi:hypothetical protein